MQNTIFYTLIYIIEAFIILFYAENIFYSKSGKFTNLFTLCFLYTGLLVLSLFQNYILNILFFLLANFIYLFLIYQTAFSSALFHSIISTTLMGMSELTLYSIMPHFINEFFAEIDLLRNIVILTVFSKTLYFLMMFTISHFLSKKYDKNLFHSKTSFFLLCIPLITLFVMTTLFMICRNFSLTPFLDMMISISSILLLLVNLLIFLYKNLLNF